MSRRATGESEGRSSPRRRSRLRVWTFRLLAATLAPLLFLGTLELGLRMFGVGRETSFFVESDKPGEYLSNRRYTWTHFGREMSREPIPMVVSRENSEDVYRIVVFGGSAAHGVPNMAFSFSRILEAMFERGLGKKRVEVINTGTTAINSHVVRQLIRDCRDFQADLYLVYMGNNEFIGPYAPGTIFRDFSPSLRFIRAGIFLRSTRTGQLYSDLAASVGLNERKTWRRESALKWLMEHPVSADDPRRATVYENFRANLTDICEEARRQKVPLLLSTVVTNLQDQIPFSSKHRDGLSAADRKRWEGYYSKGVEFQKAGTFKAALEQFAAAEKIDPEYAELHYRVGRCQIALQEMNAAREAFVRARDLDTLRVRADSEINNAIREVAAKYRQHDVYLVDAEKSISDGIPGAELLYEHVHFNFSGNHAIASLFFHRIHRLAVPESSKIRAPAMERCIELTRFNPYHHLQGVEYITRLLTGLPNSELHTARPRAEAKRLRAVVTPELLVGIASDYRTALKKRPTDLLFRLNLVEVELALGQYANVVLECRRLLEAYPDWVAVRGALARALFMQGRSAEAIAQLVTLLEEAPSDTQARKTLGLALLERGELDRAREELDRVLQEWPEDAEVHAELARWHIGRKEWSQARSALEKAIETDPGNATYPFLMAVVLIEASGDAAIKDALQYYSRSLRLDPNHAKAYVGRGKLLLKQGELDHALSDFSKAVELSPEWPEGWYRRAQLHFAKRDAARSIADLKKSLEIAPPNWPARRRAEKLLADLMERR